jgi:hypothetical protein
METVEHKSRASSARKAEAAELLKRMLDAGQSKYEPDPLAALDQATR